MSPSVVSHDLARPGWTALVCVAAAALLLRLMFYPGFFGSDEVTYIESAYRLLDGDWSVAEYVGANRYGVNLPVAAFAALFGPNEASAAAYSLLCSILEVLLVAWLGARLVGPRGAVIGALLLASVPVHVHFAGRLMADAPFALAATASFLFFSEGEARRSRAWWFLAGCAAGWTFWVKPAAVFYVGILLAYPIVFRRFTWQWLWVVGGFVLVVLANSLFFHHLTGRFWFVFEVMSQRKSSGYMESELAAGQMHDQAGYYLEYLFGKVYHTWLLGPMAVAALFVAWARRATLTTSERWGLGYVVFCGLGLVLILSLLVLSLRPLVLVPKQTNYMLIFTAPLCLLAGWWLARLGRRAWVFAVLLWGLPAMALSALQQATTSVFTANSKAAIDFARAQPNAIVHTSTNGFRAAQFERLVRPHAMAVALAPMADAMMPAGDPRPRLAIVDTETIGWGGGEPFRRLQDAPPCWQRLSRLEPRVEGVGPAVARGAAAVAGSLPIPGGLAQRLRALSEPQPAIVFAVPAVPCR